MKVPYTRAYVLVSFADFVESQGSNSLELLTSAGFSENVLNRPERLIPYRDLCLLFELSSEKLARPSFGLELALSVPDHFPNVGPTVLIAQFVGTFREWIEGSMRYLRVHTNALTLRLLDDGQSNLVTFRFDVDAHMPTSRQHVEYVLGNSSRMGRIVMANAEVNPSLVRFQHSRPRDTARHDEVFRCPIEFDAPHNELLFERRLLDFPIHGSLKNFKWLLDRYIRNRIRRVAVYDQSMTAMVSSAVRSILGSRVCSSEFVASSLGMNSKKMQRLLAQEGTSFSQILDETRRAAAIEMLLESDAPVSRIAGLLDYSTVAPFTTAFTRWTGVSPRTYRNQVKSGDPESLES